jgi:hypothetical protein
MSRQCIGPACVIDLVSPSYQLTTSTQHAETLVNRVANCFEVFLVGICSYQERRALITGARRESELLLSPTLSFESYLNGVHNRIFVLDGALCWNVR